MTGRPGGHDQRRSAPHASVEPIAAGRAAAPPRRVRARLEFALVAIAVGVVWTLGSWLLVVVLSLGTESTQLRDRLSNITLIAPVAATLLASTALCSWSSRWRRASWIAASAVAVVWLMAALGFFLDVAWGNL